MPDAQLHRHAGLPPEGTEVPLRLMALSDLHGHLAAFDYARDTVWDAVGLTRTASLIRAARTEVPNCLLFDNGDFLQGTALTDGLATLETGPERHPVVAAYNALAVDAGTIGNHEFNFGLPFLRAALAGAAYPLVLANLHPEDGSPPLCPGYVMLDRLVADRAGDLWPLRVAVTGITPPQCMIWDHDHLAGRMRPEDGLAALDRVLPQMLAHKPDLVVVLSHGGPGDPAPLEGAENLSVAIGARPEVDVVITGHLHGLFPDPAAPEAPGCDAAAGRMGGAPAVMPGHAGSHLGLIDLTLRRRASGWQIADSHSSLRPIARRDDSGALQPLVADDPLIASVVRPAHQATRARLEQTVGHTPTPLFSHFAPLGIDPAARLVAEAQRWFLARAMTGHRDAQLPLLSAVAPFKLGGRGGPEHYTDIAAGPLRQRDLGDLYVYPNRLVAVKVTGAGLRDWLEHAAGLFAQIAPGSRDAPLIAPGLPHHDFDVIAGLTWQIDLSQPARFAPDGRLIAPEAQRVQDLRHAGQPVSEEAEFLVATNNYRACGGGHFPGLTGDSVAFDSGVPVPQALQEALAAHPDGLPQDRAPLWSFVPMPDTSVLYDTGPGALAHLGALAPRAVTPLEAKPSGFVPLRVALD